MFGGFRIGGWRQCNAVSPAVTATQTGPGTHNGMALTVAVVNGAAITITGPQYQSSFQVGATGAASANAPAEVTMTPQYTGSLVYGAVNRNNAAPGWSVLQSASGTGTTTCTVTYPNNVAAGTKLLCAFQFASNAAITSVQDAAANPLTQISVLVGGGANITTALYAMDTPAGDVGTKPAITVTVGAAWAITAIIQEVAGLAVGNTLAAMVDGTPGTPANGFGGTTTGTPAYSTTATGEYLVSVFGATNYAAQTWTVPSGYTADTHSVNSSATGDIAISYCSSTGGAENGAYALSGTASEWGVLLAAFKLGAATAWTPAAASLFSQNVVDAVNGAAYGTFQSPATPYVVQAPHFIYATSGSSVTVNFASPTTAGNTVVVCVVAAQTTTNPTVSGVTLGGSADHFTSAISADTNVTADDAEIWYDPGCAGGQTAVAVTFNAGTGTGQLMDVQVFEVSGALTTDVTAASYSVSSGPSFTSSATAVTSQANEIWFGCALCTKPGICGSSWTSVTSPGGFACGYQLVSAEAAAAFTGSLSPPGYATAAVATFYLAGGTAYTTAGVPVTAGATNGDGAGGADGGIAAVEIPSLSGGVASDPSAPPPVSTTSATSVTTAHFTPPMGALLVAMAATAGTNVGLTVTDDNGQLTWVEIARWASGTSGYAGVWAAVVVCG